MSRISVIVPFFNRAACIGRCMESVYAQTHRPIELILVDNGSTDGSHDFCRSFMEHRNAPDFSVRLADEPRRGACCARNTGFQWATGDYVLFFDSDDEMFPTMLSSLQAAEASYSLRNLSSPDLIACRNLHDDGKVYPKHLSAKASHQLIDTVLSTHNVCIRRDFAEKCGPWDERLQRWQDLEYGFRLLLHASSVVWTDKPLYAVHDSPDAISNNTCSHDREILSDALQAISCDIASYSSNRATPSDSVLLQAALCFRQSGLAAGLFLEGDRKNAARLYRDALESLPQNAKKYRPLLALHYAYTRKGGRGFWRFARWFF